MAGHQWFGYKILHHLSLHALMIMSSPICLVELCNLYFPFSLVHKLLYKTPRGQREEKSKSVIFCSLTDMRNLINTKGALGLRGYIVLYALIGLLVSEVFARPGSPEEELSHVKLRLSSLENRYRHLCNQYANLATNCSGPVIKCTECPAWWFQVGDQCFHLSTDRQDWANSTKNCTEMGGHLAILTTREQHEAVEKESRSIGGFYTDYWIGLTDSETEGDWKWVDNSTLQTPFWNALKSEPDNNLSGGPEGEDCVVVDSYSQSWFDVPCSFLYPRICQMDATPLS